ncbi:MAG: hypothetical protein ACTSP1_09485 [Candidatus Freyarchaeota archaeon]
MAEEKQASSNPFLQKATKLREKVECYFPSYKNALVHAVEVEDRIVQLCIVFQPSDNEQYTELYNEPRMRVKIYTERKSVDEAFDCLKQFVSQGIITLGGSPKKFAYSVEDLNAGSIQLQGEVKVTVAGKRWSSWVLRTRCRQTLEKIYPAFNFNKLYSILKEERGVDSLRELISELTRLECLEVDAGIFPGVNVIAPIYARISRCGLVEDRIKLHVETVEGLIDKSGLYVNILKFDPGDKASSSKLGLKEMERLQIDKKGLCILSYELPAEGPEKIEFSLKDKDGFSRSNDRIIIGQMKDLKRKADDFPCQFISFFLRKDRNVTFLLVLILIAGLSVYAVGIYITRGEFPDPMVVITVALAIATCLMAYVSKRGLDISRSEKIKPLAEEAINEFLDTLKVCVSSIKDKAKENITAVILPECLEPKPYLLSVTFEEEPSILKKLSKLLNAMLAYNACVEPENIEKLKAAADEVLKDINNLEAKLCKKYGAKPKPKSVSFF